MTATPTDADGSVGGMKWPWNRRTAIVEIAEKVDRTISPEDRRNMEKRITRVEEEVRQMRTVLNRELGLRT